MLKKNETVITGNVLANLLKAAQTQRALLVDVLEAARRTDADYDQRTKLAHRIRVLTQSIRKGQAAWEGRVK